MTMERYDGIVGFLHANVIIIRFQSLPTRLVLSPSSSTTKEIRLNTFTIGISWVLIVKAGEATGRARLSYLLRM